CRGNYARICVEVDLSKPLLSKYRLRRRVRRIDYEGLHTVCYSCGCYGHSQDSCSADQPRQSKVEADVSFDNPIFSQDLDSTDRPEVTEDFGPWMLVKRGGRRNKIMKPTTNSPASTEPPPTGSGKGNRFEIFNESSEKESNEEKDPTDSVAEGISSDKDADLKSVQKENVDPVSELPNGQSVHIVGAEGSGPKSTEPDNRVILGLGNSKEHMSSGGAKDVINVTKVEDPASSVADRALAKTISGPNKSKSKLGSAGEALTNSSLSRRKNPKNGARSSPEGGKAKEGASQSDAFHNRIASLAGSNMEVDSSPKETLCTMGMPKPMELA
ncbi:hypothetical protein LINPERHAP1_LOCUS3734, partial [Linum perenne]